MADKEKSSTEIFIGSSVRIVLPESQTIGLANKTSDSFTTAKMGPDQDKVRFFQPPKRTLLCFCKDDKLLATLTADEKGRFVHPEGTAYTMDGGDPGNGPPCP